MNVLAIDTSSKACVLGISTEKQDYTDAEILDRTHSKEILPRIVKLLHRAGLESAELDLIVYGQGPGSFTGLRIGIGVVQGLAFGLDVPVVPVSSMGCLAQAAFRKHQHKHCVVALTARQEEIYFGSYSVKDGLAEANGKECVVEVSEAPVQLAEKTWVGVGSGWLLKNKLEIALQVPIQQTYVGDTYPDPLDLLHLGISRFQHGFGISALQAIPEYLREQVASPPKNTPQRLV